MQHTELHACILNLDNLLTAVTADKPQTLNIVTRMVCV